MIGLAPLRLLGFPLLLLSLCPFYNSSHTYQPLLLSSFSFSSQISSPFTHPPSMFYNKKHCVHCWLPIIAGVTISLTTWIFLDAVWAKRAADEVLENPQSRTEDCYGRLPLTERKELVRRARALQPLYLGLGDFTELSFDVIISVWDEVLNQLLFLLSL